MLRKRPRYPLDRKLGEPQNRCGNCHPGIEPLLSTYNLFLYRDTPYGNNEYIGNGIDGGQSLIVNFPLNSGGYANTNENQKVFGGGGSTAAYLDSRRCLFEYFAHDFPGSSESLRLNNG
jgi:hypothetical protein